MPELPEIEVLRRSLAPLLVGERILGLRVRNPDLREPVDRRRLGRAVRGREIEALRRRAKYLLVNLGGGHTLVVHLGMSGRLTLLAGDAPVQPHEHVAFRLARVGHVQHVLVLQPVVLQIEVLAAFDHR